MGDSHTIEVLQRHYASAFASPEWTLQADPAADADVADLVARRNRTVSALAGYWKTHDVAAGPGVDGLALQAELRDIDADLTAAGVTVLTSDGSPLRDGWCDCLTVTSGAYWQRLGGGHGWACAACRRVTQTG